MSGGYSYSLIAQDGAARRGRIQTAHGMVETPAFMPVGTAGTVKALYTDQVRQAGADVVLGNVYHLMLRPTAERVAALGGLHRFMNWPHTILTDSGGFQIMSLGPLRTLDEQGVTFKSHIDGTAHSLTPERSMEIQSLLGSDIHMQLDECIALPAERTEVIRAMELSARWAERSKLAFEELGGPAKGQGLHGIVQGGTDIEVRLRSAQLLTDIGFGGYSVGGLAVGEPQDEMLAVLDETCPALPADKPRYLMGVGTPDDLLKSVARGIDMFDCVMPTRAGRHATAYTRFGKINLKNARHADDPRPLDEESPCPAARDYSRAYLHHLVKAGEPLSGMLLSWNNIAYYQQIMREARQAIEAGQYADFLEKTTARWAQGDLPPYTGQRRQG
ncbi:MAG: tRNA guanosine(34) transglycosylase Tgt [Devosiaceae bacterium]|nr:tRNA guanosine(34) transglycosylase Tgt [Devosiaceae bacterium MH13]